jgi:hypothetical protein
MANTEAPNTLLSTQTLRVVDILCEGPISGFITKNGQYGQDPLISTYYDDVPVRNVDGSYNFNVSGEGFAFNYALGTVGQTGIDGFQTIENLLPLSSNTRLANPPEGGGPYKTVVASFTSNTFPDANSVKVTVKIPGLFGQDENGNTNPYTISYAIDISLNGAPFVEQLSDTITGKCTQPYLKTVSITLPKPGGYSFYEWKIRVRRTSKNILSIRTQNEIYVDSISVVSSTPFAYPNTAIVATEISANQFSAIPTRSYEIAGLLVKVPNGYTPTKYSYVATPFTRQCDIEINNKNIGFYTQTQSQTLKVYPGMTISGPGIPAGSKILSVSSEAPWAFAIDQDPTATSTNSTVTFTPVEGQYTITPASYPAIWDGTFQNNVWTDNPAWVFYDLLTNSKHGLGDYITPDYVDKWTLYSIAQYCDQMVDDGSGGLEPQFTCNVQIQQPEEAYTVLLNLASTFRGMLYYANGAIHPVQTRPTAPVFSFNNSNVVNGAFSYSDSARNTRATVAVVKWVDPDNGYRESVEYVEDIDGILKYGYNEKQMTAFACTSRGQAYRLGKWTLETERYQTETVTFQTDLEGTFLRPGDNFAVYDNFRNNRTQAGRIVGIGAGRSTVTLDRPIEILSGPTYTLTAITPQLALMGTGSITGSDQIDLIRNSQIESYKVTTSPTSSTSSLTIQGQFNSSIYTGSPFILSVSGSTGYFDNASFYTCLATSEIEPGKIEVLGLKAMTGVNFRMSTGVTVIDYDFPATDYPNNPGDFTTILPPTNPVVSAVTGILPDNTFYANLKLNWTDSPSINLAYYLISGKAFDENYQKYTTTANGSVGYGFERNKTGQYQFRIASVSEGGLQSSFVSASYTITNPNPLGGLQPLSGVVIISDYDPLYRDTSNKYTGYIGTTPTFQWKIVESANGNKAPDAQFTSGYKFSIRNFADTVDYITPVIISGVDNTTYQIPTGTIYNFAGGAQRGFKVKVDTIDNYGTLFAGASLNVNNPPIKVPFSSGFIGYNGGISYTITPSVQYDTSGVYLWANATPSFTPTYQNYQYVSSNLAGFANIAPQTGNFYTWFAISDTWGLSGNSIYGPVSGNANQMFGNTFIDINSQVTQAFGYLTGEITNLQKTITGVSGNFSLIVNGLSGSFTGLSGSISQAMSVQLQQTFAASGFATSQQLNATSAYLNGSLSSGYSGALAATGATLLQSSATMSGVITQYVVDVAAVTTGANASVQVMTRALVTGSNNGVGGYPIATWGFRLGANNRASSLVATTTDFTGQYAGDLVLGNMNIKSDTYSAGSAGWIINGGGNAEFNNVVVRGDFTGGQGNAKVSANSYGLVVGNPTASRLEMRAGSGNIWLFDNDGDVSFAMTNYEDANGNDFSQYAMYVNSVPAIYVTANDTGYIEIGDGRPGKTNYIGIRASTRTIEFGAGGELSNPSSTLLQANGDVNATAFNTTSSRRFKDNIRPLSGVMELIHQLNAVQFDWNNKDIKNDVGFIAEEVNEVLPTIVGKDDKDQVYGLEYGKLTAVSIEAIKILDQRLKEIENRIK